MDRYPAKQKPKSFTFSPLPFGPNPGHCADDELPPGHVPKQMNLGHFQAMTLSPYGVPFRAPLAFDHNNDVMSFGNKMSSENNKAAGLVQVHSFPSYSANTNFVHSGPNMSFPTSVPSNSRLTTPERFIRTVSQENVGKLKINASHEVNVYY